MSEPMIALRDCGKWLSGGTPPTDTEHYWDGSIPWITASSLKKRILTESQRTLTEAGVKAGSRLVPKGSILFVVRGMSLKKEFRVGRAGTSLAFGQDCKAIIPHQGVDSGYLLHALEALEPEVLKQVEEASHGTGRLPTKAVGSLQIRLPELKEQRQIAEILDTVDGAVDASEREIFKLRQLRAGLAADLMYGAVRTVPV